MTYAPETVDRALGAMVGLAVGDALGASFEGGPRRNPGIRLEMTGGGPHGMEPGGWTDDTAMALCLMDSLKAKDGRVMHRDLMRRFADWMENGSNSHTGTAFDIGWTTRGSICEYVETGNPITGPTGRDGAGNGGIMRLAPAVIANLRNEDAAAKAAVEQSRTTHGAPQCLEAADLMARILHRLIHSGDDRGGPVTVSRGHLEPEISEMARGYHVAKEREAIRSTGYVVHTLEAALWAFSRHDSFEGVMTEAVNLGGDTDTVGAVVGQIAGAAYGLSNIPERWLTHLKWREDMVVRSKALLDVSGSPSRPSILRRLMRLG